VVKEAFDVAVAKGTEFVTATVGATIAGIVPVRDGVADMVAAASRLLAGLALARLALAGRALAAAGLALAAVAVLTAYATPEVRPTDRKLTPAPIVTAIRRVRVRGDPPKR
jgi:hypothetical protein